MAERRISACLLALAICAAPVARAMEAPPLADDPALEARVMHIAEELRCLVCQNESIAASQSPLAVDLRKQIARMLGEGRSREQVVDFMVERYGEFVLYRPVLGARTAALWIGPFAFLLAACMALALRLRGRTRAQAGPGLTDEERRRAREMLDDTAPT